MVSPKAAVLILLAAIILPVPTSASPEGMEAAEMYDLNGDGALDRPELIEFFLDQSKAIKSARARGTSMARLLQLANDLAGDALTIVDCPSLPCPPVPLASAASVLFIALSAEPEGSFVPAEASAEKKKPFGWRGLGFKRFVTDTFDPRVPKIAHPVIFSYIRVQETEEGERADRLSLLGGVQLYKNIWDIPRTSMVPNRFLTWTPGVDFDIDGTKDTPETSVVLATPLTYEIHAKDPGDRFFDSHIFSISPKIITDRSFDREAWEVALGWSFTSERIRSGLYTFLGPSSRPPEKQNRLTWEPLLGISTGNIIDAAGNEKLEKLSNDGAYVRARGGVSLSFVPAAFLERLEFGVEYRHVLDLEQNFTSDYVEGSARYDLTADGNIQFTLVLRNGEKEPDFTKKDEVLIGIGVLLN